MVEISELLEASGTIGEQKTPGKKLLALTALARSIDALKRSEYEKALKLLMVSQQLRETRAAIAVALCIEVARISLSSSAWQEAVDAAEDALRKESVEDSDSDSSKAIHARWHAQTKEMLGKHRKGSGDRNECHLDSHSHEEDAGDPSGGGNLRPDTNRIPPTTWDNGMPREAGGAGSTCATDISARRSRAEARRQERLAEERAELRRKEAARREAESLEAERRSRGRHRGGSSFSTAGGPGGPFYSADFLSGPSSSASTSTSRDLHGYGGREGAGRSASSAASTSFGTSGTSSGFQSRSRISNRRRLDEVEDDFGYENEAVTRQDPRATMESTWGKRRKETDPSSASATSFTTIPASPSQTSHSKWPTDPAPASTFSTSSHTPATTTTSNTANPTTTPTAKSPSPFFPGFLLSAKAQASLNNPRNSNSTNTRPPTSPTPFGTSPSSPNPGHSPPVKETKTSSATKGPDTISSEDRPQQRGGMSDDEDGRQSAAEAANWEAAAQFLGVAEAAMDKGDLQKVQRLITKVRMLAKGGYGSRLTELQHALDQCLAHRVFHTNGGPSSPSTSPSFQPNQSMPSRNSPASPPGEKERNKAENQPRKSQPNPTQQQHKADTQEHEQDCEQERQQERQELQRQEQERLRQQQERQRRQQQQQQEQQQQQQKQQDQQQQQKQRQQEQQKQQQKQQMPENDDKPSDTDGTEDREEWEGNDAAPQTRALQDVSLVELFDQLGITANELLMVVRLILTKSVLVVAATVVGMCMACYQQVRLVHGIVGLLGLGLWWLGGLRPLLEVALALFYLTLGASKVTWTLLFWDPNFWVWPVVLLFGTLLGRPKWLATGQYLAVVHLLGGAWLGATAAAMLFHERATTGQGFYSLAAAAFCFGVRWAWVSWWGVLFLVTAIVAYFVLVLIVQASYQDNASKGLGLGPQPVPAGAPPEVARVLAAPDFYQVLELQRTCTADDVRRMAKRKKLQTHPDKTGGAPGSSDAVQRVGQAEETLKEQSSRTRYDIALHRAESGLGDEHESQTPTNNGGGGSQSNKNANVYERSKGQPRTKGNKSRKSKTR